MQTNRLSILFVILYLCFTSLTSNSQEKKNNNNTLTITKDSIIKIDSIPIVKNKAAIQYIIEHSAEDYILEDVIRKKVELYNEAHVIYDQYDIRSGKISIDYNNNTVQAKGIPDEKGLYSQLPIFKSDGNETTQDSLIFNYKTKKAIIYGLETEQDGINTFGEKTKRVNDSTIFVRNIIFTTSDPRDPDYYLKTTKAKIVPGKKIITGPTYLVLADVPTPAIFPFAYFPLSKSRSSGIIFPTYGESFNQGFFLQNGGYYLALNDFFDLKITTDIYSNSSWGITIGSNYRVRYKYSGNFNFNYDHLITDLEGFSSYGINKNFNLSWSHSQDSKASPNSQFSTSVNLGSSQYFRQSVNESNTGNGLQNTLSSSINYSNRLVGTPFNMNISATHRQNTNTKQVTATLPSLRLNMDRLNPFAPKNGTKKNALQRIGLTYSFQAENKVNTTEDKFFSGDIFDDAKNGAKHVASLSTNTKLLKYFTLSPSINYNEVWYTEKIRQEYDAASGNILSDNISGFNSYRSYSAGTSLTTVIYGMYRLKNSTLKAIRHTMRPSFSYTYRPDFSNQLDAIINHPEQKKYNQFNGFIYSGPSSGISNSLNFSLANTLEGKITDKEDPEGKDKKISILKALNFNSRYNFTQDKFKLSSIGMTGGTTLFKKMNINFGATFDAYALVDNGVNSKGETIKKRINSLSYKNGGPLLRLTRANLSTGYSFSSKDFGKKKDSKKEEKENEETAYDQDLFGQDLPNTNSIQNKPQKETNNKKTIDKNLPQYISSMPWNFRFSYNSNYSVSDSTGKGKITNNSLVFSGDIQISPGWQVGASSGYDFVNKGFTFTNLRFNRDLRSLSMSFNWTPLGNNSSYYFFIGVKSSVLSDLKWEKRATNRSFN